MITFTAPDSSQYEVIWACKLPAAATAEFKRDDESLRAWVRNVPCVGFVCGGSDMAGSWDEEIAVGSDDPQAILAAYIAAGE